MLLDLPEICNMPKDVNVDAVLSIADLILTQPVKETNRFTPKLSAAYLKQHKKDGARVVEISLLNFSGYFPQYSHDSKHLVLGRPLVSYGDANIDQMVNDGCTTAEIARRLSAEDYYDGNELTCHFAKSFQAFCAREETCDIKMQDYLKVHYRDDILFHAFNHPKDFVIKELARRILRYIGIVSDDFEDEVLLDKSSRMYAQEQPVYPSVYRYLKLPYRKPYASPNLLATGWRFAFRDYVEFYVNALKEDSSAPQPQKRQTTVFIWGSCISRELFNYTEAFDLTGYLLQNSIQTLQAEAVEIPEEDVKGSSNFTKRMFLMESRKTAVQYFQDHKADYLMIDTCDCRNHVWRNKRNPKIRFCSSITADQTMALPKYNEEYEKISVFAITEEEWDAYVDHFCDVITQVYPVERIILNKFRFAEDYIKDGEVLPFPNQELYRGFGRITASIEQKIEERLPGIQVISPEEHTIGDYYSHIGTSAMHFLDEIYMRQAKKLEDIVYG